MDQDPSPWGAEAVHLRNLAPTVHGGGRSSPQLRNSRLDLSPSVATQDRVFPHYIPNSSIKHSKSDSKDRSQEIL
jgi:hypothetical protein